VEIRHHGITNSHEDAMGRNQHDELRPYRRLWSAVAADAVWVWAVFHPGSASGLTEVQIREWREADDWLFGDGYDQEDSRDACELALKCGFDYLQLGALRMRDRIDAACGGRLASGLGARYRAAQALGMRGAFAEDRDDSDPVIKPLLAPAAHYTPGDPRATMVPGICIKCNETAIILARGKCRRCYEQWRRRVNPKVQKRSRGRSASHWRDVVADPEKHEARKAYKCRLYRAQKESSIG